MKRFTDTQALLVLKEKGVDVRFEGGGALKTHAYTP